MKRVWEIRKRTENIDAGASRGFFPRFPPLLAGEQKGIKKVLRSFYLKAAVLIILGFIFCARVDRSMQDRHEVIHWNHYVHQAAAFLKGNVDIPTLLPDGVTFNGKYYVVYPPFPTFLLLPLVALFGININVALISVILAVCSCLILIRLLQKTGLEKRHIPWMLGAFFWGTPYWLALIGSNGVSHFAHIVAVTALLIALNEALGKGRGIWSGLFLGFAFLTRQLSIYFTVFFIAALWFNENKKTSRDKILNLLMFAGSLGLCVGIYLCYNWLRFGNILDTGYSYIELIGFCKERVDKFGEFSIYYIPFNFIYMFLQGFHINFGGFGNLQADGLDSFGTAITYASPFIIFAFWAGWEKSLLWTAWISIGLILLNQLMYYNNGWVQINAQRFTLDFFPLLILLVAMGIKRIPEPVWKTVIAFAVLQNALAVIIFR
ncbi:MAG: glycosyl transferase family 39 [Bacillota bacterium]